MQALTIARVELTRRIRSRSAIITSVLAPLALAMVFGVLFDSSGSVSFTIGVVDESASPMSAQIVDGLLSDAGQQGAGASNETAGDETASNGEDGSVEFVEIADRTTAASDVDDEVVGAAILIGDGPALTVLTNPSSPLSGQVAESIASAIATSIETGGAPPVELDELPLGGRNLSAPAYFGASMAILLLFFATGLAAQSILEDKENRTLDRILAGPTTAWAVLIGKVIAVSVFAVGGFTTVWLVTSFIFDANWGSPVAVFLLIVCTIFALAGVSTFVGGFASTAQQATTLTAVVTFGLSLLGGNFTGPADAPAALRAMRRLTPNGRALEAFTELSVDAASVGSIAATMGSLILFGLVFGAIGLLRIHRTVAA